MQKIVVFLLSFIMFYSTVSFGKEDSCISFTNVFKESGLSFTEAAISGWVKMDKVCENIDDLKSLAHATNNFLSGGDDFTYEVLEASDKKVIIKSNYEWGSIKTAISTVHNDIAQNYESITAVDITQQAGMENINDIRRRLNECLSNYGTHVPVNICITGYTDGRMEQFQREKTVDDLFLSFRAIMVEKINNDNLISVSGYSRGLPDSIKSNNKDINLNVACRYSSFDNKTYFWLGTPVINIEY